MTPGSPIPKSPPRRAGRWLLAMLAGAVVAVLMIGAAVWLSTGLGLLRLMGLARGGATVVNISPPKLPLTPPDAIIPFSTRQCPGASGFFTRRSPLVTRHSSWGTYATP